jgi:phosphoserine phosphatase
MDEGTLSPIWVERVIEKHHGPAAEVEAHLRAFGLSEKRVAAALRAWAERHGVALDGAQPGGEETTEE